MTASTWPDPLKNSNDPSGGRQDFGVWSLLTRSGEGRELIDELTSISPDGRRFIYTKVESQSDLWIIDNFDPSVKPDR